MRFRVLGGVEVEAPDGRVLTLSRRQERCVLAVLLLQEGRVVPIDRLCALLWEGSPPERARRVVRTHVARIRGVLAEAGAAEQGVALVSRPGGYVLEGVGDALDAVRFRTLLDRATAAEDLAERDRLLRAALDLWRGVALSGAASDDLRQRLCGDLDELYLRAVEESLSAGLALGRHRELLPDLARAAAEHPTRERITELYMLALHRAGRTADALAVYARARTRLAEELGLDPGPALRQAHQTILRGETDPPARAPAAPPVRPAQLPPDPPGFVGRETHLRQLDTLLTGRTTVAISALAGTAGVGKTTLAVHWAHRVRDRFPDGQLHVNLRGFDPSGSALAPTDVLRGFLDALGVPAKRIPTTLEAQVGLYRSLLAGKRMLVMLDNARDPEQVRPLLPGGPGCLALVTSRSQLAGLAATDGAVPVALDLLSVEEARDLLARRLDPERTAAEQRAVDDIIDSCVRLPLALAIVAARAATTHQLSLTGLAAELREAHGRLDAFAGDDTATNVRAVFSWSYRALSTAGARLFRLVGLHPGPDLGVPAAASLAGIPAARARSLLAELTRAHLLTDHLPGRYTAHDLLRAYAAELARTDDPDAERYATVRRALDHYLHTAHAAERLLVSGRSIPAPLGPSPGVLPQELADSGEAMAWFATERPVLMAAVDQAATFGFDTHICQFALNLKCFLDRQGHWRDQVAVHQASVEAARRLADVPMEAGALYSLADALNPLGRFDEGHAHYKEALRLFQEIGDTMGQAYTCHSMGWACELQGDYPHALEYAQQSLELFRRAGNRIGQARAANAVGWYHTLLGEHRQALRYCGEALRMQRELGDQRGMAATLDSIGYAHHHLGEYPQAIGHYRDALDLYREVDERRGAAETFAHLGDTYHATGEPGAARAAWQQALAILDPLEQPEAAEIRAKLDQLDGPVTAAR